MRFFLITKIKEIAMKSIFSSESVTEGHPDKMCDQISDAVLDAMLTQDRNSRVACETFTTTDLIVLGGEIRSKGSVDFTQLVRQVVREIGYTDSKLGFNADTCEVMIRIGKQSQDIAQGVDGNKYKEQGAGDQGIMFGYACRETDALMPMPIQLSHQLVMQLTKIRKEGTLDYLGPDGKSQVSVRYEGNTPVGVETVVISCQHAAHVEQSQIYSDIKQHVIDEIIPPQLCSKNTRYLINPSGRFVIGGPQGDAGLTGRKVIVDTYGGMGRHGGGAFSGKDPSKVDRSAAYMARYIAKNIVASSLAERCEIQLAYAIGEADPVSVMTNTYGTGKLDDEKIANLVVEIFGLKPLEIIEELDLLRPIYRETAAYGHFGRALDIFTWEKTDKADQLRQTF